MKIYLNAYIAQNLGDDLFLDILLKRYPHHDFYALTQVKNNYHYPNLHLYHNSFIYKFIKKFNLEKYIANRLDMVVTIGGSMFMENQNRKQDLSLGKKERYILGTNFGPYQTNEYYQMAYHVFQKCKDVCFREKYSYELFRDLPNVRWLPDIAFGMDVSDLTITNRKRAVIVPISYEDKLKESYEQGNNFSNIYETKMVELIERLSSKEGYEIVLLSMCENQNDNKAVDRIFEKCSPKVQKKIEKYDYKGNIKEALNIFADASLIVGSRFHANIIGMILGKAIIPFIYSDKTIHMIEDVLENSKSPKPLMVDIRKINDFDVSQITQEDLNKIMDVSNILEKAEDQFQELDKALK